MHRLPERSELARSIRARAVSMADFTLDGLAIPVQIIGAGTGYIEVSCECGQRHTFAGDWTARDVRDACEDGGPRCPETGVRVRLMSVRRVEDTGTGISSGTGRRLGDMRVWWEDRAAEKTARRNRQRYSEGDREDVA